MHDFLLRFFYDKSLNFFLFKEPNIVYSIAVYRLHIIKMESYKIDYCTQKTSPLTKTSVLWKILYLDPPKQYSNGLIKQDSLNGWIG